MIMKSNSVLWLDGAQLQDQLPYARVVDALKTVFDPETAAPARHVHSFGAQEGSAAEKNLLLLMPAWNDSHGTGGGVKLVTYCLANRLVDLPVVHSLCVAIDAATGTFKAILDGGMPTNIRTAALCTLAATYLARPDSEVLQVVGTGELAGHLAQAHAARRNLIRRFPGQ